MKFLDIMRFIIKYSLYQGFLSKNFIGYNLRTHKRSIECNRKFIRQRYTNGILTFRRYFSFRTSVFLQKIITFKIRISDVRKTFTRKFGIEREGCSERRSASFISATLQFQLNDVRNALPFTAQYTVCQTHSYRCESVY